MSIAINTGEVGAITDYPSLFDAIKLWLDRGSDLDLQIPTFIRLIEPYLNRVLRTPEMDAMATPALASGVFTLPADCLQIRSVNYGNYTLDGMSPAALFSEYMTGGGILSGIPSAYAISGNQGTIAPSASGVVGLTYWQRIPALTATAPVNWLLTSNPDIYLYGALAQAEGYIENPDRAAQWTNLFEASVQSLIVAAQTARYGGPIRARGVQQVYGVRA